MGLAMSFNTGFLVAQCGFFLLCFAAIELGSKNKMVHPFFFRCAFGNHGGGLFCDLRLMLTHDVTYRLQSVFYLSVCLNV